MTKQLIFVFLCVLGAQANLLAQDTIREVYPPKHLYLPFSFGYAKTFDFGTRYAGQVGDYQKINPEAIRYSTGRISFDYCAYREDKHAINLGVRFELYQYLVMDLISTHETINDNDLDTQKDTIQAPLMNNVDFAVSGFRFAPYFEYNYAFKQDKRKKHSAGFQVNFGAHREGDISSTAFYNQDIANSWAKDLNYNHPFLVNGGNHGYFEGDQGTKNTNAPKLSKYSSFGLQLHYDFLYVHTNFDDLRIRAYYSFIKTKSTQSVRYTNGIGIGLFLHLGAHFPKIQKF